MTKITKEELRVKLAEIEGYTFEKEVKHNTFPYGDTVNSTQVYLYGAKVYDHPTYDNETDILRVVRLLDDDQLLKYFNQITDFEHREWPFLVALAKATAPQMLQALAQALGYELEGEDD